MLNGQELRFRRALNNLSQKELAEKLQISRQFLHKLENDLAKSSKTLEARYDAAFGSKRITDLFRIHDLERGADCPYCGGFGSRIWRDETNPERDVYACADCDDVWRAGKVWALTDNKGHDDKR